MVLVLIVLVSAASLILLAWTFQRQLIYMPFGEVLAPQTVGLTSAELVEIPTEDGLRLHGWFVAGASSPASATVVVFNGNAGNRSYRGRLAAALQSRGLQVLLFDYRGFGGNPGTPTETGLRRDARAVRNYLLGRTGVDETRLVYFGESLGSAVAIRLATEHAPAALIVRSPFPSLVDVGRLHYPFLPVRHLLKDRFEVVDAARRVTSPVLVIVGDRDRVVPAPLSRRVYESITASKKLVVVAGADHNDHELLAGDRVIDSIMGFLRRID